MVYYYESKPSMFWANILKDASMTMTVSLREIIRSALAIPAGSTAAERLFGTARPATARFFTAQFFDYTIF